MATSTTFDFPREKGSAEWAAFRRIQNDLRPLSRFFRHAVDKNALKSGMRVNRSLRRTHDLGVNVRGAYND